MRTYLRAATAGLLAGTVLGSAAGAADLTYSLWIPPQHPLVADLEAWGASLGEATDGSLNVEIYPAQQLGSAPDHYDMARDGLVDMSMVAPGYTPGRFPIWNLNEMPFTFANSTTGARALHEWYADYIEREMPDTKFCFVTMHHPGTVHTKDADVQVPSDLEGLQLRPAGPGVASYLTEVGAATVQAALPEVRELAERGVVDGVTFAWDIIVVGADTILTHHMDLPLYVSSQAHVLNQSFYDGLTDEEKAAVDDHCTPEWSEKLGQGWAEAELAARDKLMSAEGHTTTTPTPEQVEEWRASAQPVVEAAEAAVEERYSDLDGRQVFEDLRASAEAHGALYKEE